MSWNFFRQMTILLVAMFLCYSSYAETVWIDVRSSIEHYIDSIEGDILIPHDEIVVQVGKKFPDKSTEIRLYCRSGVRAGKAKSALKEAGYTNVFNIGGIDDARIERGITE